MNTQVFFVRSENRDAVTDIIAGRLEAPADPPGQQPRWGLESSYDTWLAGDPKRKVAVSPPQGGWIAGVESKEVLDFAMLQILSAQLDTEVVACQLAGTIDSWGYARSVGARLIDWQWKDNDPDPFNALRAYLCTCSIPHDIITFREAIALRSKGWTIVQKR